MPVLGITGGIATGKTAVTSILRRNLIAEVFDADAVARELVTSDASVQIRMRAQFGSAIFSPSGELDRGALREIVFKDPLQRQALEAILHPVIREKWLRLGAKLGSRSAWLLVDLPLLFETAAETFFDAILVVACSRQEQRRRLCQNRNLSAEMAESIVCAQKPLAEKMALAGHVIWNDGSHASLERQSFLFISYLTQRYG